MFRWFVLISLLFTSFAVAQAKPENWKVYGSFIYAPEIPKTLIFFDEIKRNARYDLRKALRNHDIETIVLSSYGGSVFEGLEMADIIHYRGLNTFIPKYGVNGVGKCASACAFMFLAGKNKRVDGQLGVHQFYSNDSKSMEQVSDTEEVAQYTVAEIIGFLNEYETPPFVYEKMFQQKKMYYFDNTELKKIETNRDYFSSSFVRNVGYAFTEISKVEKIQNEQFKLRRKL